MRWITAQSPATVRATVEAARKAMERQAGNLDLWMLAGQALDRTGDIAAAREHWAAAVESFHGTPEPRVALALALERADDFQGALDELRALALCRETATGAALELRLLLHLDRWSEAEVLAPVVERLAPACPSMIDYHARNLADRPGELLAACDRVLAVKPGQASALHHRARALSALGRYEDARETLGIDRFVSVGELPQGADFHSALRAEILANKTLRPDPRGHATRIGLQTAELVMRGNRVSGALCDAIRSAVDVYAAKLQADHWFVRGRPATARLRPWAVVYGDGGHQVPHSHPAAWLSGVFYVGGAGAAEQPTGALLLGIHQGPRHCPDGQVQRIAPLAGRLVMFPAATTHATEPAGSGALRISVAFDVIDQDC